MFLDILKYEMLTEETRISSLPKKFSNFLLYLRAAEPVTYELLKNFTDYWWMENSTGEDGSVREATMGVAMHQGRLQFYIGKGFYSRLSISQLAFLMYHELAHYKRGHCNNNFNLGKANHNLANICEDIYINEDANRDGYFALVPLKFVDGVLMKKSGKYRGATGQGIDKYGKVNGLTLNEKDYMPIADSAELYVYLSKEHDKQGKPPEKKPGKDGEGGKGGEGGEGDPPPPRFPKRGDIVKGPDGTYGRVNNVVGNVIKEIEPLTEQEAMDIVKKKISFMAIKTRKNMMTLKDPIDIA